MKRTHKEFEMDTAIVIRGGLEIEVHANEADKSEKHICPECRQPVRHHRAGGHMPDAHFEHNPRNYPACSKSDPDPGKTYDRTPARSPKASGAKLQEISAQQKLDGAHEFTVHIRRLIRDAAVLPKDEKEHLLELHHIFKVLRPHLRVPDVTLDEIGQEIKEAAESID
jgi:hypothetical protein